MRISDWSSDVCSSDLFVFVAHRDHPVPPGGLLVSAGWCLLAALILSALCGRAGSKRQAILFAGLFALVLDTQFDWYQDAMAYVAFEVLPALEIGRASCRERVWQYV